MGISWCAFEVLPEPYNYIALGIILFLLAEPHFLVTIPIIGGFKDKNNFAMEIFGEVYGWRTVFIYFPGACLIVFGIFLIVDFKIATLLFLAVNFFHVNRQSSGVVKLSLISSGVASLELREIISRLLWAPSVLCFSVFVFQQMTGMVIDPGLSWVGFVLALTISMYACWYLSNGCGAAIMSHVTGSLIWLPGLVYEEVLPVIVLGVSMHYLQYLYLSIRVLNGQIHDSSSGKKSRVIGIVGWLIIGSAVMTTAAFNDQLMMAIAIPMFVQMYHFIVDSFLWRGSCPSIRANVVGYVNE